MESLHDARHSIEPYGGLLGASACRAGVEVRHGLDYGTVFDHIVVLPDSASLAAYMRLPSFDSSQYETHIWGSNSVNRAVDAM
jgi:hypothetical protein